MLRYVALRTTIPLPIRCIRHAYSTRRDADIDEAELASTRKWLSQLSADIIPRNICDISFSRSSGPGGQNVNKVSSKATVRIPTASVLALVPPLLHQHIMSSRYTTSGKSSDLVIQADDSRKQADNVNACFKRLHELIAEAGRMAVPGETSVEQSKRVEALQKAEGVRRRKAKEMLSKKKAGRRSGGRGDD